MAFLKGHMSFTGVKDMFVMPSLRLPLPLAHTHFFVRANLIKCFPLRDFDRIPS